MPSTLAQDNELKGSNFAIWQPCVHSKRRPFVGSNITTKSSIDILSGGLLYSKVPDFVHGKFTIQAVSYSMAPSEVLSLLILVWTCGRMKNLPYKQVDLRPYELVRTTVTLNLIHLISLPPPIRGPKLIYGEVMRKFRPPVCSHLSPSPGMFRPQRDDTTLSCIRPLNVL